MVNDEAFLCLRVHILGRRQMIIAVIRGVTNSTLKRLVLVVLEENALDKGCGFKVWQMHDNVSIRGRAWYREGC